MIQTNVNWMQKSILSYSGWVLSQGRQTRKDCFVCTLGLFVLWQSSWQPPCVSSFAREALGEQISNKHKHAHTQRKTLCRPWAKVPVQTDKLAFIDMLANMCTCMHSYSHAQYFFSVQKVTLLSGVCVMCVSHLISRRWKTKPSKLCMQNVTSCNLSSFLLDQASQHWNHNACWHPAFPEGSIAPVTTHAN